MNLIRILFLLSLLLTFSFSKGEVSKIFAHEESATKSNYTANGHKHKWGEGKNLIIDGFEYNGHRYNYVSDSPIVKIRRVDNVNASGEPCGLFAEKKNGNEYKLNATFPQTNGNCDMAKVMAGRTINVGALDLFRNVGHTAKNVERVDFISPNGIFAPYKASDLSKAGHVVTEKSGNNYLQIAAILSIDENNNPTSYGPLVMVYKNGENPTNVRYGMTHIYLPDNSNIYAQSLGFYVDNTHTNQGEPWWILNTTEALGMAFVTLEDLGVSANQKYYGFSYFGRDVSSQNDTLTDVTTFPTNTGGDTADPYGGVASYFVDEELGYGTCYGMIDNGTSIYEMDLHSNDEFKTITIDTKFKGEGTAYRSTNNKLYAFQTYKNKDSSKVEDHGRSTTLFSIDLSSTNSPIQVKKEQHDFVDYEVEGAEFYYDPVSKKEIMYVISSNDQKKNKYYLHAFYADNWDEELTGYPKRIKKYKLDSLAIDPNTGQGYAINDGSDDSEPKVYKLDLSTGVASFLFEAKHKFDAEGLAFAIDGKLYTEDEGHYSGKSRKIYRVDLEQKKFIETRDLTGTKDIEGLSCNGMPPAPPPPVTPFSCTTEAYLFNGRPKTDAYTIDLSTGDYQVQKNSLEHNINATGYNVKDNLIWGYSLNKDKVIQIDADYNIVAYDVSDLPHKNYYAGDVSLDGILYLHAHGETKLYKVNLNSGTPIYDGYITITEGGEYGDYAFNPVDNMLYTTNEDDKHLYKIDVTTGIVTDLGNPGLTNDINFHTYIFDKAGNLYFYGESGKIYQINLGASASAPYTMSLFSTTNIKKSGGDGARCPNAEVIQPNQPIAEYRFDECSWNGTANEVKNHIGSIHGKAKNGASTTSDGKIERSGIFNKNSNHYVDLGDNFDPISTDKWSISIWFKTDTNNGEHMVYSKDGVYVGAVRNGYFQYAFGNDWGWRGENSFPVSNGQWYHAVVTYDGNQQKLYKNGTIVYERNYSGNIPNNSEPLLLGKRSWYGGTSYFDGNIDEFKLYDNTLTSSYITTLYDNERIGKDKDGTTRTEVVCTEPCQGMLTIKQVVLKTEGELVIQNASGQGGLNDGEESTPVSLESITLNINGEDVLLNSFATHGFEVENINIPNNAKQYYFSSINGEETDANSVNFKAKIEEVLGTTDIRDYIRFETNNTPTSMDIIYKNYTIDKDDYIMILERGGNSSFHLEALDVNGDVIEGSQILYFTNGDMAWNTGYKAGLGAIHYHQNQYIGVIKASCFNVGFNKIYGFRLHNNNGADPKFFVLGEESFGSQLVAEYRFDECSWNGTEGEVKDHTQHNRHGTAKGTANTIADAIVGRSGKFNGVSDNDASIGDFVEIENHALLNKGGAFTVSTWFKAKSLRDWNGIITTASRDDRKGWNLEIDTVHTSDSREGILAIVGNDMTAPDRFTFVTTDVKPKVDEWHHIVLVHGQDNSNKLYVDGVFKQNVSKEVRTSSNALYIAKFYTDKTLDWYFDGQIDEVKIWEGALTQTDITSGYNFEKDGKNWDGTDRAAVVCEEPQEPFICQDNFYVSNQHNLETGSNEADKNWLHTINRDTPPYSFNSIGNGFSSQNGGYNAIGYRLQDNFIYGMYGNILVKIDSNGVVKELGEVEGFNHGQTYAGEFDRDGYYYVKEYFGDHNKMYKIDVVQKKVIETITLSQSVRFWDMAIDETGEYFYAMLINDSSSYKNDKVAKIKISDGTITTIGNSHANVASYISLVFSDIDGDIFMMSNENGFYKVNTITGALQLLSSTSDLTFYNDGTSCANANIKETPIAIAEYRFDECSWNGTAGEVKDNIGTIHGTAKNETTTNSDGKIERSGIFDKSANNYLDLGNNFNPNSDKFSISVWFKSNTTNGEQIIYNKESLYEVAVQGGYFQYAFRPHWHWDGGTSFPVVKDTWYHAVITYDGIKQRVYKDGVEVYSRNQTGDIGSNTSKLLVGARGSDTPKNFFDGNIDELKIYDNTLSATSIKDMYDNEKIGKDKDGTTRNTVVCRQDATPIAEYRFDECTWDGTAGEVKDSSGNAHHANAKADLNTINNGKVVRAGEFPNESVRGTEHTVNSPLNMDDIGGKGAISFWFNSNDNWNGGVGRTLIDATKGKKYFYLALKSDGKLYYYFEDKNDGDFQSSTKSLSFSKNTWVHITIVWDLKNSYKLYINGQEEILNINANTITKTEFNGLGNISFGDYVSAYASNGRKNSLNGFMDEVKIYDKVLSTTQIEEIYDNENIGKNWDGTDRDAIVCSALNRIVAEYHFDECYWNGIADEVKDSSGNNLHGTAQGHASTIDNGKVGRSGLFDGKGDFVEIAHDDLLNPAGAFSVSTWFKASNYGRWNGIISKLENGNGNRDKQDGWNLQAGTVHKIASLQGNTNDGWAYLSSTTAPVTEQWYHAVMVHTGNQSKLYINGVLERTMNRVIEHNDSPLHIAKFYTNYNALTFDGQIDEVKIFDGSLTGAEVTLIYNNEKSGKSWDGTDRVPPTCIVSTLSINDISQKEGDTGFTSFDFTLSLDVGFPIATSVTYTLNDGTATIADNDYVSDTQVVSFAAEETSKTISVQVVGDYKMEYNENFTVDLSNPRYLTIADSQGIGTILNDDVANLNVERTDSLTTYNTDKSIDHKYNLYTQIAKKDFHYTIVAYDGNSSNVVEEAIEDLTVKVELIDATDSNDSTNVLTTTVQTFNAQSRIDVIPNDDLENTQATRNAYFKIYYPVDINNSVLRNSSCTTVACLEALPNFKEFKSVRSKDSFAIRPAGFKLVLSDDNGTTITELKENTDSNAIPLAAGYEYKLEVEALGYTNNTEFSYAPQKYILDALGYPILSPIQELNATLQFEGDMDNCADTSNKKFSYYEFTDGINDEKAFSYDNVGEYSLQVLDENWTNTDHSINDFKRGCNLNSSSNVADAIGLFGCDIDTQFISEAINYYDLNVTFEPYSFDVNMSLTNASKNGKDYLYMGTLENNNVMAVLLDGNITALAKDGNVATNFTDGCHAKDLEFSLDYLAKSSQGDFNNTTPLQVITTKNRDVPFQRKISHNNVAYTDFDMTDSALDDNITLDKRYFEDNATGRTSLSILYNIEKHLSETINPVQVTFNSPNVAAKASNSHIKEKVAEDHLPKGDQNLNTTKTFYFTRIASDKEDYPITYGNSESTPLNVEIFCEHNIAWCDEMIGNNGRYTLTDGWYSSINHDSNTDGNITNYETSEKNTTVPTFKDTDFIDKNQTLEFKKGRIATFKTTLLKNADGTIELFKDKNKVDTRIEIDASPWLLYHPTNTDGKPFWENHFVSSTTVDANATNAGEWSGIGQAGYMINTKSNTRRSDKMEW